MIATKKRFNFDQAVKIFIIALLSLTVIIPLYFILPSMGEIDVLSTIVSQNFLTAMVNSFLIGIVATAISVAFAFSLAFILNRIHLRLTGIMGIVFCIPMLIPSIAHGMGIVVLFGNNGVITNLFGFSNGLDGFWAIVLGSVMYSFPTAFLMIGDIFKYEDRTVYEAADSMGIPKHRQFFGITLPYTAKPMISVIFATFTLVFTDYGVPMMVGGRFTTLPLYMYNEVIGQLNFGIGAIVAIVLIIPAIAAFVFDLFNKDTGNIHYAVKDINGSRDKKKVILCYIYCAVSAILILLPIIVFSLMGFIKKYPTEIVFGFDNILRAFNMNAGQYLLNSLFISVMVSILGTLAACVTAYLTSRVPSKLNRYLHLISILSLAIPGMVLGISYSLMYKGSFLMGTFAMLILVNSVHFFSSPYLMCYNALNKVNRNYETVAKTMQISRFRLVKNVILPQTIETVIEMFAYFFINSMVTISAVSFLATSANMPLSLLINKFETQMFIESAAFVSFMILIINGLVKFLIYLFKRYRSKQLVK